MRRASMLLLSARCGALLPLTRCTGRRRLALRAETIAAETDAVEYVVKRSRFAAPKAPKAAAAPTAPPPGRKAKKIALSSESESPPADDVSAS